jgi:4-hydroxybenzoate polyprenyltransferase
MIGLFQSILWFNILPLYNVNLLLSTKGFIFLVLSSIFIAAGGNVVNDIYDRETDNINKPEKVWIPDFLSLRNAWVLYFSLTILGLFFGILVTNESLNFLNLGWFVFPVIALFLYASRLKKIIILNNILISFLVTYSILVVFLIQPFSLSQKIENSFSLRNLFWFLILFSFALNIIREIVKDIEDLEGDKATGVKSIPIQFGMEQTKNITHTIVYLLIGIILAISISHFKDQPYFVGFLILLVFSILLIFNKKLHIAKQTQDFRKLSTLLKIIMLIGFSSLFLIRI